MEIMLVIIGMLIMLLVFALIMVFKDSDKPKRNINHNVYGNFISYPSEHELLRRVYSQPTPEERAESLVNKEKERIKIRNELIMMKDAAENLLREKNDGQRFN